MKKQLCKIVTNCLTALLFAIPIGASLANEPGEFDWNRWYTILQRVQDTAVAKQINAEIVNSVVQNAMFIPDVVMRDRRQAEFALNMNDYISRATRVERVQNGKIAAKKYPTLLSRMEKKYGVPKSVMLAFWGMESDYGTFTSQYKLSDSFLTLMYDGRRFGFFEQQLYALMELSDKGHLNIGEVSGSWAGAVGHFQFIPTTLSQYGLDGNGDKKIDVIHSVADAMASAGNYLKRLGWRDNERIARKVQLPVGFDMELCSGTIKLPLSKWQELGVIGVPSADKVAGLVCDASIAPWGYLTYDNFYRIKRWNNSNNYAIAVAILSEELR